MVLISSHQFRCGKYVAILGCLFMNLNLSWGGGGTHRWQEKLPAGVRTADQGADRPSWRGPEEGPEKGRGGEEGGRGRVGRTGDSENQLIK
jgi:hypothetical protein